MNSKLAKRLRREANYHPTDEVKYVDVVNYKARPYKHPTHRELDPSCSKSLYKELKKENK